MEQAAPEGHQTPQTVTREQLYEEIWTQPAMHLAAKYGISGSFLARVCERLRVPRPRPGYWNKLAVGKASPKPALPPAEPGDEVQWCPADTPSIQQPARQSSKKESATKPPAEQEISSADATAPAEPLTRNIPRVRRKRVPATHPLIGGVIGLIPEGKITEEGYCKPRKRLLPDIITSPQQLEAAVRLANKLYRLLEARGHRVRLSNSSDQFQRTEINPRPPSKQQTYHDRLWQPERPTVVYIGTVAIGLSLFETCEYVEMQYVRGEYIPASKVDSATKRLLGGSTWTTEQLQASGTFCLQAYSPYPGTEWSRQWKGRPSALAAQLEETISTLESQPPAIEQLIEQARIAAEKRAREWDEERQRYRLEEQAKRRAQALETSRADLLAIINEWNEQERIAAFFEKAIAQAAQISDGVKTGIENKLAAAQQIMGSPDPLSRLTQWRSPQEIYDSMPKSYWETD